MSRTRWGWKRWYALEITRPQSFMNDFGLIQSIWMAVVLGLPTSPDDWQVDFDTKGILFEVRWFWNEENETGGVAEAEKVELLVSARFGGKVVENWVSVKVSCTACTLKSFVSDAASAVLNVHKESPRSAPLLVDEMSWGCSGASERENDGPRDCEDGDWVLRCWWEFKSADVEQAWWKCDDGWKLETSASTAIIPTLCRVPFMPRLPKPIILSADEWNQSPHPTHHDSLHISLEMGWASGGGIGRCLNIAAAWHPVDVHPDCENKK